MWPTFFDILTVKINYCSKICVSRNFVANETCMLTRKGQFNVILAVLFVKVQWKSQLKRCEFKFIQTRQALTRPKLK